MIDDFSQVQRITILGVGLIGGSLGMALKANGFQGEISGLGRRMQTLEVALERGAVDRITTNFEDGVRNADVVVIGTPVDLIPEMALQAREARRSSPQPLLMTDVGGVKRQIVERLEKLLEPVDCRHLHFVGSHPMAGSEKTGVGAARADLYQGARCIITPTEKTHPQALKVITTLWEFAGAQVYYLSPIAHDTLIAGASHLPHLIAAVLTKTVGEICCDSARALDFAATGFRDTTRIAAGSPDIWTGIFTQNAHSLIPMIDGVIQNLTEFKLMLQNQDLQRIEQFLAHAKRLRDALEKR